MLKLSSSQTRQFKDIGAYLQQKRLEKNITLEDIAAMTMIRLPILHALEDGKLEQLPELVYVKGFIRRYGEILKIDGQALANTLNVVQEPEVEETPEPPKSVPVQPPKSVPVQPAKSVPVQPPKSVPVQPPKSVPVQPTKSVPVQTKVAERPTPVKNPQTTAGGSKSLPYFLLGLGGLLLAGLGYLFLRPQETQTITPSTDPPPIVKASPTVATPPKTSIQPAPEPSPAPANPLSVTVKLDDRSWIQIFVDGELGYRGTLEAGEEKTWTAKKVFNIRAGNAGAVKLSVNEKPLEPLGKPGEVKERTLKASENN